MLEAPIHLTFLFYFFRRVRRTNNYIGGGIKVHPSVTCVFKASLVLLLPEEVHGAPLVKKKKGGKNVEKNAEK